MFALADVVARATRFVIGAEEPALWNVAAEARLVGHAGLVSGDLEAFAAEPGRRLGAPVELQPSPG